MKINWRAAVIAPVAGVLLGFFDFVWIKFVPFPFGGLGNSIAVWAVAAFLVAYYCRWPLRRSIGGAVIMLVVAVPSYYIAAALIQNDDWSNIWDFTSWIWMAFGVVAGVVFGAGGTVARRPGRLRLPALGLPAAVLFAEALKELPFGATDGKLADDAQYSLVLVALAVSITMAVGRTWWDRTLSLVYAIPLAVFGYLLMIGTFF